MSSVLLDKLSDFQVGWIAGILDGEGCLAITCTRGAYSVRVSVGNTDKLMIETLVSLTGLGKVYFRDPGGNWKSSWYWHVRVNSDVLSLLTKVFPYLVTKKRKAKICIDFCRLKLSCDYEDGQLELYYSVMSMLNMKGKRKK